jgi:hypothetical protein
VPYSLLRTDGAILVVNALKALIGEDRSGVDRAEKVLRPLLERAAIAPGDPALADLGQLVSNAAPRTPVRAVTNTKNAANKESPGTLDAFVEALGKAEPKSHRNQGAIGKQAPARAKKAHNNSTGLVVDHTGQAFGGVSVFVYPEKTRDQRHSMLTRLADEKAYRRLAISKDTKWADIALGQMPVQQFQPAQDMSKGIALVEQLQRLGVGIDPRSAARASIYLRRRARLSRTKELTEADVTEAAQYAAVADLAVRLADFAADKGGADFADKGGADFADKGGADFADKGGADFADKGGADFGPR